jgi:hypothetical protein
MYDLSGAVGLDGKTSLRCSRSSCGSQAISQKVAFKEWRKRVKTQGLSKAAHEIQKTAERISMPLKTGNEWDEK